jgi:hypothetical protein
VRRSSLEQFNCGVRKLQFAGAVLTIGHRFAASLRTCQRMKMPSNIAPHDTNLSNVKELKDRIWVTYKCRVIAHDRVSKYNFHSQILSIAYTLPIIFISIIDLIAPIDQKESLITIFFSLSVLVASVFIYSQNFSGRVENIKENYLKLQNIYELINTENYDHISREYQNILSAYDNHKEIDYIYLMQQIVDKGNYEDKHIEFLSKNRSSIQSYEAKYRTSLFLLYLIPFASIIYITKMIFT